MLKFKNFKQKLHIKNLNTSQLSKESKKIIDNLKSTKEELESLSQSIDYITEPILLNQLIFQLKAAEARYQYWFCIAKELNLTANLNII